MCIISNMHERKKCSLWCIRYFSHECMRSSIYIYVHNVPLNVERKSYIQHTGFTTTHVGLSTEWLGVDEHENNNNQMYTGLKRKSVYLVIWWGTLNCCICLIVILWLVLKGNKSDYRYC